MVSNAVDADKGALEVESRVAHVVDVRSARGFASRCVVFALALASAAGCVPADRWTRIELAVDEEGELRFVTRRHTRKDGLERDFLYAEQRAGEWHFEWVSVGPENYEGVPDGFSFPSSYWLVLDGDASWLVADLPTGTVAHHRSSDGSLEVAPIDAGLPGGALRALAGQDTLGGAWLGSDGELRVLSGDWLVETRGGSVSQATSTGEACTHEAALLTDDPEECHFLPTADRAGDAVLFAAELGTGALLSRIEHLACDADCAWTAGPDPGFGQSGGLGGSWEDFVVFRTIDGAIQMAHVDYPGARVAGGGEARRFSEDAFQIGAAPRPSGGYVLATHGYGDTLVLTAVDAAGAERRHVLDRVRARTVSDRIAVVVAPAAEGREERAHVVVPTTSSTFLHFTVDLSSHVVTRESLSL